MMRRMRQFLVVGLMLPVMAGAETAFVTDMLQLDMYATSDMTGVSMRKLRSGDKLEILVRSGRAAQVRIDGQTGWVKSLYLVDDEPARTRVNQLESTNERLEDTSSKLRAEIDSLKDKVTELQQVQSGDDAAQAATREELRQLREANQQLESSLSAYAGSIPAIWTGVAVAVALLGGALASWWWIDKRSRARHGGYRIY
jgi:FtsZ-binding cell division protein ZapB